MYRCAPPIPKYRSLRRKKFLPAFQKTFESAQGPILIPTLIARKTSSRKIPKTARRYFLPFNFTGSIKRNLNQEGLIMMGEWKSGFCHYVSDGVVVAFFYLIDISEEVIVNENFSGCY